MPELLQKQSFLDVLNKHVFHFSAVLKRSLFMSIPEPITFWTKFAKVANETRKIKGLWIGTYQIKLRFHLDFC